MNKILKLLFILLKNNKSDSSIRDFYVNEYDMNLFNTFNADFTSEFTRGTSMSCMSKDKLDGSEGDDYRSLEFSKMMADLEELSEKLTFPSFISKKMARA